MPIPEISVVIPVYYNEESLEELHQRIEATLLKAKAKGFEILFVDDGSQDASRQVLAKIQKKSPRVGVLHMLKNAGSPRAIMAGMEASQGRAVAVMAADLQDPPEMLAEMLRRFRKGTPLVLAQRSSRGDALSTVATARFFYWLFRKMVSKRMPKGGFDVFLAGREVVDQLLRGMDKHSNPFALLMVLGFPFEAISYHKQARPFGASRWTFAKKLTYFYDSILSYTYLPLRILTVTGILSVIFSILYAAFVVYLRLKNPQWVQGWASLMVTLLFFSGMVLMGLGMIGEYVWRTFDAVRRLPAFVVEKSFPPRGRGRA